ncbi:MAG: maleylpyruvate isomerase N-terminal domain-containing protein [Chloroflexi bacterium]|nr:maleylpyruvate isomerase N-terminal domain-containing protein [Chloroflexota bacterium]
MSRIEVIAAVEDSWRAFRDSFERLTTADLEARGACGDWSIKDVAGHVAAWDLALSRLVTGRDAGRALPERHVDSFNQREAGKRAGMTVGEVLTELDEARRLLREALQKAPEELFAAGSEMRRCIDSYSVFHHQEHTASIRTWIKESGRSWRGKK